MSSLLARIGQLIGSLIVAWLLVALVEGLSAQRTPMGSVVPLQAHVFVLAFILIYIAVTLGDVRDRLGTLVRMQREVSVGEAIRN